MSTPMSPAGSLPLSLQLYTVREAIRTDLAGTLKKVADIGFTQVEPYGFVETETELATAFEINGLRAPSGHAPLIRTGEDQERILAAAGRLGIGTVIDPATAQDRWSTTEDIAAVAAELNAAAHRGEAHGVRVGYHNHWWEIQNEVEGRFALEILAEQLDPAVILELDTYWVAAAGGDPVALLGRLGNRVRYVHIKDGPPTLEPADQVAVGAGALPIWDIIGAATSMEIGVVELDDTRGDVFQAVAASYDYLTAGRPTS